MSVNNIGCLLTSGVILPQCNLFSVGGINTVYIAAASTLNESSFTYDANDVITGMTCGSFYEFQTIPESCEYTQTEIKDDKTGAISFEQIITLLLYRHSSLRRKLFLQILNTNQLLAIIKDNLGQYWLFGKKNFLTINTSTLNSGKVLDDMNGIALELYGLERYPAYQILKNTFTVVPTINYIPLQDIGIQIQPGGDIH